MLYNTDIQYIPRYLIKKKRTLIDIKKEKETETGV